VKNTITTKGKKRGGGTQVRQGSPNHTKKILPHESPSRSSITGTEQKEDNGRRSAPEEEEARKGCIGSEQGRGEKEREKKRRRSRGCN